MIGADESFIAPSVVDCGVASRAFAGEAESGDLHVIAAFPGGVLVAVADGLGHGVEAAAAARIAAASLGACPHLSPDDLMRRCHAALYRTRGAVLGLASIDAGRNRLTWAGVGNVDATLIRADPAAATRRETLPNRGGVVGHQMPSLHVTSHAIAPGDTLILVTDGIEGLYHLGAPDDWPPQQLADYIVEHYGKKTDDALAVVARYIGSPFA